MSKDAAQAIVDRIELAIHRDPKTWPKRPRVTDEMVQRAAIYRYTGLAPDDPRALRVWFVLPRHHRALIRVQLRSLLEVALGVDKP